MTVRELTGTFQRFFRSEQAGGLVLIACTVGSLLAANSAWGPQYRDLWHASLGPLTTEQWINDGLMAVFFLFIGLELERELYVGELSSPREALLPIMAALGGMLVPAAIHFGFNHGTPLQDGFGIPMATDIAFAIGVLALLGDRVPAALKVFVVAFAVMDDLGAVLVIAGFYTADLSYGYLAAAAASWLALVALNRLRVMPLAPYLVGGLLMWFFMLKSGVHATVAGVLLAFAIPFTGAGEGVESPSHRLESRLHAPVAFFVLPMFALANTGVAISSGWFQELGSTNGLGILAGLLMGKPLGILLFCLAAVGLNWCSLPSGLAWRHMMGAGMLGGIGFTMSIFITNLAFAGLPQIVVASKMAVLCASAGAGLLAVMWFVLACAPPSAGRRADA